MTERLNMPAAKRYYAAGGMIRTNMPCANANWSVVAQDRGVVASTAGITITLPPIVDALQGEDYRVVNASDGDIFVTATSPFHAAGGTSTGETISAGRSRNYTVETDNSFWSGVGLGTSVAGTQGPQGIPGPTGPASTVAGPTGPKGDQGLQGTSGAAGAVSTVPGPTGPTGSNGLSAYQVWLAAGNSGTQAQFLASLVGAAGATGSQGIQGVTGSAGVNATTTATATTTTAGLMPSAAVTQLAALPTITKAITLSVAVPNIALLGTSTLTLAVPGAVVGGAVILNYTDATMAGNITGMSVTAASTVSVTLKAAVAITAGNRNFTVSVINPN